VDAGEYVVFTAHREENVDDKEVLNQLIEIIDRVRTTLDLPVVYPIHPRTEKRLEQMGLHTKIETIDGLHIVDPLGYLDFLKLLSGADVVLTDSGGIQEETCILEVPCVTLRENTERPETVEVGSNTIAGTDPDDVLDATVEMRGRRREWANPFGDGNAAKKIVDTVLESS